MYIVLMYSIVQSGYIFLLLLILTKLPTLYLNSTGYTTWAIWTPVKKYSLRPMQRAKKMLFQWSYLMTIEEKDGKQIWGGLLFDTLDEAARELNFTYVLY